MNEEQHSSFRDYVGVLKRSAWIVVLAAVLAKEIERTESEVAKLAASRRSDAQAPIGAPPGEERWREAVSGHPQFHGAPAAVGGLPGRQLP